ncbi:unnamed protein product [Trichobilharzia regenti]|nr:unnamed protein product [Trichobilharzia regenti]
MSEIYFARLCTLYKWNKDSGYGFSLQATKGKIGHYITEVDRKSPAYAAGLRDDDFVVEVNGINVGRFWLLSSSYSHSDSATLRIRF